MNPAAVDPSYGILIGGEHRCATASFEVEDPATWEVVAHVTDGGAADALAAVDAAAEAAGSWRSCAPRDRAAVLHHAYALMRDRAESLADLIALENGKSRADALAEVSYAGDFLRWYAEEAVRSSGSYGPSPGGGTRTIVTQLPIGVAALVTPWNFPAAMVTRKVAPALAAGCTAVLKPAAETPLTALAIAELLADAGLPAGVVNVVPTTDPGAVVGQWLGDRRVRKISFTGSTAVGKVLLRQAAERVVASSMELGGNAPFVVTEDADVDAAVRGALVAKFRNGGQACTAANGFFVHAAIAERFTEQFCAAAARLRIGPAATGADLGPVISARAVDRLDELVEDALARGARLRYRADLSADRGWFVPPTVLTHVDRTATLYREEIFGPVAPIVTWEDEAALLEELNQDDLGLAAYVYSGDLQRAVRFAEALEVGMVGINRGVVSDPSAPFGGVKESGLGREGARAGIEAFQESRYLSVDWPD
ncbi:NAD-dependent succinate-semialdehyde dehydrogenase [Aeromicrobium phragmitis]|uniref:NAD-dependent succinate-semialdehyde dehydrogenase n=1 Tax=Aeromicrobium phragmitis TaxID=2478914 RepID=A0A3L8PPE4_9ACTN|nr:NAD-dependent succinate-semialdehyde dehydrogenase [Aeromicrobium phragmitis]RLV57241.1 NAD-dependent succinate-semialdehyde dehydrogenase [Aeromicrobium phragmitis]